MYKYPEIVEHLRMKKKKSAFALDKMFISLVTEYLPCSWFIEAGAFEGNASMAVKSKLPECKVYAFEASIDNYNHFKEKLQSIDHIQMAISTYVGKIIFKQQALAKNGIAFPKVLGNNSLKSRNFDLDTQYHDIEVSCTTLDDFFDKKVDANESVGIWLDLEGTAYEALTAATKILDRVSFLKVEVEDKPYWEGQRLSRDIVDFLCQHGITPLIRDFEYDAQFNIVFCNNKLIDSKLSDYFIELVRK
jgi:FkbM family methyltransferase